MTSKKQHGPQVGEIRLKEIDTKVTETQQLMNFKSYFKCYKYALEYKEK